MKSAGVPASDPSITIPLGMRCQQCRRPGDDIRLVNYPLILSLFTFQFRFELKGHWCRAHRTLRLLLAGFLTATLGWLGFPFCVIAVPKVLFGLAGGAGLHKGNNARMLRGQAEIKESQGDLTGAIRCMQESFFYLDDLWGRQELRRLYGLRAAVPARSVSPLVSMLAALGVLLGALALGNLTGLADYYWMKLIGFSRFPLLDALFGWLALSGLGVPATLLLGEWIRRALRRDDRPRPVYHLAFGLIAGLLLALGVLAGRGLGNFLDVLWSNPTRIPDSVLATVIGSGLTRGWLLELYRFAAPRDAWQMIHLFYGLLLVVYALYGCAKAAWEIHRWRARLSEMSADAAGRRGLAPGWLALAVVLVAVGLSAAAVPQIARLDFVEARDAYSDGLPLEYAQRYDEAAARFQDAVRLDPYMAEAYEELSWVYYQQGDAARAVAQSLRSIEVNPNRASTHYALGNIYFYEDDNEKAYAEFEKAIVLDPGYYDAYIGSGWAAYTLGDLTRAELSFLKALDHNPKPYDAYIGLGKIYEDRGKTAQAIETYRKANQTDVTSATADVYLGMAYFQNNQVDQAITNLENAVVKDPSNRIARTYLLMSYLSAGRVDDALQAGSEAVDRYPTRAGLRALFATALAMSGRPAEARQQIEQALAAADKSDLDFGLVIHALMRLGRYPEAETEANRALQANPGRGEFYLDLAAARQSQEKYSGALEACALAEQSGVKPAEVAMRRARIFLDRNELDASLEQLQKARSLGANDAALHTLLGRVYYEQGDLEQALQETSTALSLDAYNLDGYINLGFVLLETGNGRDAIKAGAQAARLSPDLDVPHFILGMGYLSTGQDNAASNELSRYLQLAGTGEQSRVLRDQAQNALQSLRKVY